MLQMKEGGPERWSNSLKVTQLVIGRVSNVMPLTSQLGAGTETGERVLLSSTFKDAWSGLKAESMSSCSLLCLWYYPSNRPEKARAGMIL